MTHLSPKLYSRTSKGLSMGELLAVLNSHFKSPKFLKKLIKTTLNLEIGLWINKFHRYWRIRCFVGTNMKTYQDGPKVKGNIEETFNLHLGLSKPKEGGPQPSKSGPRTSGEQAQNPTKPTQTLRNTAVAQVQEIRRGSPSKLNSRWPT